MSKKKVQLLLDRSGRVWKLLDIRVSKSLVFPNQPPEKYVHIQSLADTDAIRVAWDVFEYEFRTVESPKLVNKVIELNALLLKPPGHHPTEKTCAH